RNVPASKSASASVRPRKRYPRRAPKRGVNWYSSSNRLVFSSCFRKRAEVAREISAGEEVPWVGVPGTPFAGGRQVTGVVPVGVNTVGLVSKVAPKKLHRPKAPWAGLWK